MRFDEFSVDILENRLLKAAMRRLSRLPLRSGFVPRALHEVWSAFDSVAEVEFNPHQLPQPIFTRLNRHYEPSVALALLILKSCSFDSGTGGPSANWVSFGYEQGVRVILASSAS